MHAIVEYRSEHIIARPEKSIARSEAPPCGHSWKQNRSNVASIANSVMSMKIDNTVSSKCSRLVKVMQGHFYLFFLIFVQKK